MDEINKNLMDKPFWDMFLQNVVGQNYSRHRRERAKGTVYFFKHFFVSL